MREFTRCRTLYEKFLEFNPENVQTWMKFAELETLLGDVDRARGIYELAINQPRLDMPEILWKGYIDFETEQEETDRARELYRRLLDRTQHVKVFSDWLKLIQSSHWLIFQVWLSLAQFERQNDHEDRVVQARHVYEEANKALRQSREKEERLMLLEAWTDFEGEEGDEKSQAQVQDLMPRRVKKRRKIETEDGSDQGWEEYFDYIFPEDEAAKPNLKLLAMAKMWKKQKETVPGEEAEDEPSKDTEEERIPIVEDSDKAAIDEENPDADDQDIVNESSEDEESEDEESDAKKARLK